MERRQSRIFEPGLVFYCDALTGLSRAIRILADHCNIEYDLRLVDITKGEHKKPLFLGINPKGNLPVIFIDETDM